MSHHKNLHNGIKVDIRKQNFVQKIDQNLKKKKIQVCPLSPLLVHTHRKKYKRFSLFSSFFRFFFTQKSTKWKINITMFAILYHVLDIEFYFYLPSSKRVKKKRRKNKCFLKTSSNIWRSGTNSSTFYNNHIKTQWGGYNKQ